MLLALAARSPDDDDLLVAFRDFMFRWQSDLQAGSVNCEWSIDVEGDMLCVAPHATLQVLRVAQEGLTNVAKHANASRVELSLWSRDGRVGLRIADDGVGIPAGMSPGGRGTRNMRERALQLAGTLAIEPGEPRGTVVTMNLPLAPLPPRSAPQA